MNPVDWRVLREMSRQAEEKEFEESAALRHAALHRFQFGAGLAFLYGSLVLAGVLYFANYSGSLRWVLAFLIAIALGAVAVRLVAVGVRDPEASSSAVDAPRRRAGEVRAFAATLERAARGLKYSQIVADERLREALLVRLASDRGVGVGALEAARADPRALETLLGDGALAAFVRRSDAASRHWPHGSAAIPRRPNFWREYCDTLAKVVSRWT